MFYLKTAKTVRKTRKKHICSFLAMLFCTLVIVSGIGSSFAIRNSYAQTFPTQTPNLDPTTANIHMSKSQTSTNTHQLPLIHQFISNKVVGPDRFRFIGYYWTTSDTARAIDVAQSAGTGIGFGPSGAGTAANVKQEVDTNEGQNSIAIQLQYEGVLPLDGVTAALKLPAGFKASVPLTDAPNRWDIALAQYRGIVVPGQGITLYFTVIILPTAQVGLPVLGPVALHFLRPNMRSITDNMDAMDNAAFARAFENVTTSTTTGTPTPPTPSFTNTTTLGPFSHTLNFNRDYSGSFQRIVAFDYINQVIPVIFKVTGRETLDVVTLPPGAPVSLDSISTHIVKIPNDDTSRIRIAVTNTGDAGVYDMTVNVFPGLQSSLGINGLTSSAISSPNIPQTLFSTILPIGIVGHSTFYLGEVPADSIKEFDVFVYPTHYVAGTVELLNVLLTYDNVIGTRITTGPIQPSENGGSAVCNPTGTFAACGTPTLNQVYFAIAPSP
jgi:hypothetical protein